MVRLSRFTNTRRCSRSSLQCWYLCYSLSRWLTCRWSSTYSMQIHKETWLVLVLFFVQEAHVPLVVDVLDADTQRNLAGTCAILCPGGSRAVGRRRTRCRYTKKL